MSQLGLKTLSPPCGPKVLPSLASTPGKPRNNAKTSKPPVILRTCWISPNASSYNAVNSSRNSHADFVVAQDLLGLGKSLVQRQTLYLPPDLYAPQSPASARSAYYLELWPKLLIKWQPKAPDRLRHLKPSSIVFCASNSRHSREPGRRFPWTARPGPPLASAVPVATLAFAMELIDSKPTFV